MTYTISTICNSDKTTILQRTTEDDPEVENNKLSRALIELWQPNSEATSQETEESDQQEDQKRSTSLWTKRPSCTF